MPVGESPVQLRISKAEGRHTKEPPFQAVFSLLLVLEILIMQLLLSVLHLGMEHHTPEGDIARADPSEDYSKANRLSPA